MAHVAGAAELIARALPDQVGARVHSDSWGSSALDYDYMASEVDLFTWDNQVGDTQSSCRTAETQQCMEIALGLLADFQDMVHTNLSVLSFFLRTGTIAFRASRVFLRVFLLFACRSLACPGPSHLMQFSSHESKTVVTDLPSK